MKDQSKGKIFLAAERGHTETEWFRSYNSFNFGGYQSEHKKPFGDLYVLNDDTLAGGRSFSLTAEEESAILLLPVVGAVGVKDGTGNERILAAGESFFAPVEKGAVIEIRNPYDSELVNFLHCWFKMQGAPRFDQSIAAFRLDENKNTLLNVTDTHTHIRCLAGKFDGRCEAIYPAASLQSFLFVFVVQGAFEVQNRLLETRDGLALWNVAGMEFEALSNDAIILLIEMADRQ